MVNKNHSAYSQKLKITKLNYLRKKTMAAMQGSKDYSNRPKLIKCNQPILFFCMQLDGNGSTIPGLNDGRLSLWDYEQGLIHRWVATSSISSKQGIRDWEVRGGVHPPNYAMPDNDWFYVDTKLIIQPGQRVERGFIHLYKESNYWTTNKGNQRSEVMLHPDENYQQSPGSEGCIVMKPKEYEEFEKIFLDCCQQHSKVRLGVMYTFQA